MIEFQNVSKSFGNLRVLENTSFSVSNGEVVGIAGKSGAGKSTVLKLVSGIFPPTTGRIQVNCFRLGYIFQNPRLLPWKTVLDNVILPLCAKGVHSKQAWSSGLQILERLGLKGFENTHPAKLSGGMRQRVAIARALLIMPDLLLMDEPFNGIDSCLKEDIFRLLQERKVEDNLTVVFVSHNTEELSRLVSRTLYLGNGNLR